MSDTSSDFYESYDSYEEDNNTTNAQQKTCSCDPDDFVNLPLRNYIEYNNENKDLYWVNIGYNLDVIQLKVNNIFYNIFQLKYGKSYKVSKYFFNLSDDIMMLRMCIDTVVQQDYHHLIFAINFEEKIIPITSIMGCILTHYGNPQFSQIFNGRTRTKNISNNDRTYINNTLFDLESALEFILKQAKLINHCEYKKIKSYCGKITKKINNIKINI